MARPLASKSLRARVRALEVPEARRAWWAVGLPSRRVALAVAAAALLGTFVAAGVTGLGGSNTKDAEAFHPSLPTTQPKSVEEGAGLNGSAHGAYTYKRSPPSPLRAATAGDALAPTAGRLQRYEATLRLRVKDVDALSRATQRAIGLARDLGGYVGSVRYATRSGRRGGATLLLRVPVAKVQTALAELSGLGTILQQRTGILDVTRRADREAEQIANLERALETATPTGAVRIRHRLATLRAKQARLLKSARFARITLGLTTPARKAAAAPGRFHRTLDDAGSVLLRELQILLYGLVVGGPLLLLGAGALAAGRSARRRADARLLERA